LNAPFWIPQKPIRSHRRQRNIKNIHNPIQAQKNVISALVAPLTYKKPTRPGRKEEKWGEWRQQQNPGSPLFIVTVTEYNSVTVTKLWEKPCYNRIKERNLVDLLPAGTGLLPNASAISEHGT
jgi:hypothetical protein